jgi:hypothetical protein
MYEDNAKEEKEILDFIEKFPLTVSTAQQVPIIGLIVDYIERRAAKSLEEKRIILFDELNKGNIALTKDMIESDEFINRFIIVLHAMERTNQKEKIILFARLLRNRDFDSYSGAIFEEQLNILEQLSVHELKMLVTLDKYEEKTKDNIKDSRELYLSENSEYFDEFVSEVKDALSLSSIEDVEGMLSRLTRTGLYEQIVLTCVRISKKVGMLTPLYYALKEAIQLNEANFS